MSEEHKKEIQNQSTGAMLNIPVPAPWGEPVDGNKLLEDLLRAYKSYVVLPTYGGPTLALWTLYTYGFQHFEFSPRLAITSPEKRCGKSTLLIMLEILTHKALTASNISTASIYRVIELEQPTLLLDEADTFLRREPEMAGILNAGHRVGGQTIRTEYRGRQAVPTCFKCFSPCAIAAINKKSLPEPLLDRSICIQMRRKTADEHVERLRTRVAEQQFYDLRRKCVRFMSDFGEEIARLTPEIPDELSSRAADNWEPLLAIADFVGGIWPKIARNAAIGLIDKSDPDDENLGTQLLLDIRQIFANCPNTQINSTLLCDKLADIPESPWAEYGYRHERINPRQVAKRLREYNIQSVNIRYGHQVVKGYRLEDFQEAFDRYLPKIDRDTATIPENESDHVAAIEAAFATINI